MARSKKTEIQKSGLDPKFLIMAWSLGTIASLIIFLRIFGLDLGFIKFKGVMIDKIDPNIIPILILLPLCFEYYWDVKYVKALKRYSDEPASFMDYIPFVNLFAFSSLPIKIISIVCASVITIISLVIFTPLGGLLPVEVLVGGFSGMVTPILVCAVILLALRGIEQMNNGKIIAADYKKLAGDYGGGGMMATMQRFSSFIPLLRIPTLQNDIAFINTTKGLVKLQENLE